MQIESAKISIIGDRETNQDRVGYLRRGDSILAVVMDGMGGHSQGEIAAEIGLETMLKAFADSPIPVANPQQFLVDIVLAAHEDVIRTGQGMDIDLMPRSTAAVCLIQDTTMYWVHVGDSRLYHIRDEMVVKRTRDHTHVETLLQQGVITESQVNTHPMRNYVDSCLGGEIDIHMMSESGAIEVDTDDVILICSDGIWTAFQDNAIAKYLSNPDEAIEPLTKALCDLAVQRCHPYSDNASAIVLRLR